LGLLQVYKANMGVERGGGENSSIWRLHLSRASLLGYREDVTYISPNPGHEVTETVVVLPSSTLPGDDQRRYMLNEETRAFELQPLQKPPQA
jgi:hypothetical protein